MNFLHTYVFPMRMRDALSSSSTLLRSVFDVYFAPFPNHHSSPSGAGTRGLNSSSEGAWTTEIRCTSLSVIFDLDGTFLIVVRPSFVPKIWSRSWTKYCRSDRLPGSGARSAR